MKKFLFALGALALTASAASAQYGLYGTGSNPSGHYVQGYTRSNGTYVQPHMQSNSNRTQLDNWSTRGNLNPYTGRIGTRTPRW